MNNRIGIMQGRLSSPSRRGILQEFPKYTWEKEFDIAKDIGFDYIEWIFDSPYRNPLFLSWFMFQGVERKIKEIVKVDVICADYFMKNPLWENKENIEIFNYLLAQVSFLNVKIVVLPILGKSLDELFKLEFESLLRQIHFDRGIKIALETDLDWKDNLKLIKKIGFPTQIGLCYDIGNAMFYRRDIVNEIKELCDWQALFHVHIKERNNKGESVPLESICDWEIIFKVLKKEGYTDRFTLQLARGEEGREKELVESYYTKVKEWVKK